MAQAGTYILVIIGMFCQLSLLQSFPLDVSMYRRDVVAEEFVKSHVTDANHYDERGLTQITTANAAKVPMWTPIEGMVSTEPDQYVPFMVETTAHPPRSRVLKSPPRASSYHGLEVLDIWSYTEVFNFWVILMVFITSLFYFLCSVNSFLKRWESQDDVPVKPMLPSYGRGPKGEYPYLITVSTSSRPGAGLNSGIVKIKITGHLASTETLRIPARDDEHARPFRRGCDKKIIYYSPVSLAGLTKVDVELESNTKSVKWYLNYVTVIELASRKQWYFPCCQWFTAKKGSEDRKIIFTSSHRKAQLFMHNVWRGLQEYHVCLAPWLSQEVHKKGTQWMYIGLMVSTLCGLMLSHLMVYDVPFVADLAERYSVKTAKMLFFFIVDGATFAVIALLQMTMKEIRGMSLTQYNYCNMLVFQDHGRMDKGQSKFPDGYAPVVESIPNEPFKADFSSTVVPMPQSKDSLISRINQSMKKRFSAVSDTELMVKKFDSSTNRHSQSSGALTAVNMTLHANDEREAEQHWNDKEVVAKAYPNVQSIGFVQAVQGHTGSFQNGCGDNKALNGNLDVLDRLAKHKQALELYSVSQQNIVGHRGDSTSREDHINHMGTAAGKQPQPGVEGDLTGAKKEVQSVRDSSSTHSSEISYGYVLSANSSTTSMTPSCHSSVKETWQRCWNNIKSLISDDGVHIYPGPAFKDTPSSAQLVDVRDSEHTGESDPREVEFATQIATSMLEYAKDSYTNSGCVVLPTMKKSAEKLTQFIKKIAQERMFTATYSNILNGKCRKARDGSHMELISSSDDKTKSNVDISNNMPVRKPSRLSSIDRIQEELQLGSLPKELSLSITSAALENALGSLDQLAEKNVADSFRRIHNMAQEFLTIDESDGGKKMADDDSSSIDSSYTPIPLKSIPSSYITTTIGKNTADVISADNVAAATCASIQNVFSDEVFERVENAVTNYSNCQLSEFSSTVISTVYSSVSNKLIAAVGEIKTTNRKAPDSYTLKKAGMKVRETFLPLLVDHILVLIRKEVKNVEKSDKALMRMLYARQYIDTIITNAVMQTHVNINREIVRAKNIFIEGDGAYSNGTAVQNQIINLILQSVQSKLTCLFQSKVGNCGCDRKNNPCLNCRNENVQIAERVAVKIKGTAISKYLICRTLDKMEVNMKQTVAAIDEKKDKCDVECLMALGKALLDHCSAEDNYLSLETVMSDIKDASMQEAIESITQEFMQDKVVLSDDKELRALVHHLHFASRRSKNQLATSQNRMNQNTNAQCAWRSDDEDCEDGIMADFTDVRKMLMSERFVSQCRMTKPIFTMNRNASNNVPTTKGEDTKVTNGKPGGGLGLGSTGSFLSQQILVPNPLFGQPSGAQVTAPMEDVIIDMDDDDETSKLLGGIFPDGTASGENSLAMQVMMRAFLCDYLKDRTLKTWLAPLLGFILMCVCVSCLAITALVGNKMDKTETCDWFLSCLFCLLGHGIVIEPIKAVILAFYWTFQKQCVLP